MLLPFSFILYRLFFSLDRPRTLYTVVFSLFLQRNIVCSVSSVHPLPFFFFFPTPSATESAVAALSDITGRRGPPPRCLAEMGLPVTHTLLLGVTLTMPEAYMNTGRTGLGSSLKIRLKVHALQWFVVEVEQPHSQGEKLSCVSNKTNK